MAQGRGNAATRLENRNTVVLGMYLLLFLCVVQCVQGSTYVVGDGQGWGFSIQSSGWTSGKNFMAGDTLVFNYSPGVHSVVVVDVGSYNSCNTGGSTALTSGSDKITLKQGANYFICGVPGHCAAGMKLSVTAT